MTSQNGSDRISITLKDTGQPWNPGQATGHIRGVANDPELDLTLTKHAREQMARRRIIASELLWVLRQGFVRGVFLSGVLLMLMDWI